jgi:large subunit ribosomal protein L1
MGKKRNIVMDASQDEELQQQSSLDNKYSDAYDLPEEFALLDDEKSSQKSEDTEKKTEKKKAKKVSKKRVRSKKYLNLKKQVDKQKKYSIDEAIKLSLSLSKEKFDASIELNLESRKNKLSGQYELPHGTGKDKKIAVVTDEVLGQIKQNKIDFDMLIAKPEDMPKLAKYAKFLGPRGLMPNPKNGTISADPEKQIKALSGKTRYKTEKKAPLIHLLIGKRSFGDKKLKANLLAIFKEINPKTLVSASLSSAMGPGIKLNLDQII